MSASKYVLVVLLLRHCLLVHPQLITEGVTSQPALAWPHLWCCLVALACSGAAVVGCVCAGLCGVDRMLLQQSSTCCMCTCISHVPVDCSTVRQAALALAVSDLSCSLLRL